MAKQEFTTEQILDALQTHKTVQKAAKALGISYPEMQKHMRQHGICANNKDNQTLRKVVDEWYYWKTWKATLPCNLKNWLMGWRPKPEDCLPYYKEHQAQEQAAAQKRVEQAKADLNEAADEFNA